MRIRIVLSLLLLLFLSNTIALAQSIKEYDFLDVKTKVDIGKNSIYVEVPYGTDVTGLIAVFKLSSGATAFVNDVQQVSGETLNDFTNPVTYIIYDEDGDTREYLVSVKITPNKATDFISYSFPEQIAPANIDTDRHRINVEVAYGTDVTGLIATFELSDGAIARVGWRIQVSGQSENDFSDPVNYRVIAMDGSTRQDWRVTVTIAPRPEADILEYNIPGQSGDTEIDFNNGTVDVIMPYGTDVSNLISSFTLSKGATASVNGLEQISGVTSNDFTDPVIYTVTAYDDETIKEWTVTVTELPNDEAEFLSYSFPQQSQPADIDSKDGTIDIEVVYGTDPTILIASFTLSDQATASIEGTIQTSGVTGNDFTSPVLYTVTAGNGSTKEWTVSVTVALNSESDFLSYALPGQKGESNINETNHTIEVDIGYTTELDNLIATFSISPQAETEVNGVLQESGVTPNDFSEEVIYTVIAGDQSEQDWTVQVTVLPNNETDILTFSFEEETGPAVIQPENHTVQIEVRHGTDRSNLIAHFSLSPYAKAFVGNLAQESGVTSNDFSGPVTYTILAGDEETEQDWSIEVSVAPPSNETNFLAFSLEDETGHKIIDTLNHEIFILVQEGTELDLLVASFTLSPGATAYVGEILQVSGVTINNFTKPVIYTILAEDGTTQQSWTVYVSIEFDFFYIKRPLAFPVSSNSIEISARAPEYESIQEVNFHFKRIDTHTWTKQEVSGNTGIYKVDLTRNLLGNGGVYYYFTAIDTAGNRMFLDYYHLVLHYDTEYPEIPALKFGGTVNQYQIISIPLTLNNPNAEAVFDELGTYNIKYWRLFHHDGISTKEYKNGFTNIDPGLGYWLIVRNQEEITTGEGQTVRIDSTRGFEIDLKPGWNQIGNPFDFDISWDHVIIANNNLNIGRVKVFYRDTLSEGYEIPRYRGGFVFLEGVQPITATVNPSTVAVNGRIADLQMDDSQKPLDQSSWSARLILSNNIVTNTLSGIGMHPEATAGKDRFDDVLIPVPMEIIPFQLSFNYPDETYKKFSKDVVPTANQHVWEFEIKSHLPGQELILSWDNSNFGNNDYKLILNDIRTEKLIDMRERNTYTFNAGNLDQFRIFFGDQEFINSELKPRHITLGTTYPNPFDDHVIIPFTIPEGSAVYEVDISVYDLTGNHIQKLTRHNYGAGYYSINWNPYETSTNVQRGLYFIRLTARNDKQTLVLTQKVVKR